MRTAHLAHPTHLPRIAPARWRPLARCISALALLAIGWAFIAVQNQALWQRLPAATVDRFVADRISAPLPARLPAQALLALCAQPPGGPASWVPALARRAIAPCLNALDAEAPAATAGQAQPPPPAQALQTAADTYRQALQAQVAAAQAWLLAFDAQAPAARAALAAELARLQQAPAQPVASGPLPALAAALQSALKALGWAPQITERESLARPVAADAPAQLLRRRVAATQALLQAVPVHAPSASQVRQLGLAATGQALVLDFAEAPAKPHLTSDKATLADALEWLRRGQAVAERGFSLAQLHGIGSMLLLSAALLVAVAAATGARGGVLLLWVGATQLLGLGALLLTDLALTGDVSMRTLAVRQFLWLGSGSGGLALALPLRGDAGASPGWALWWPLLLLAALLLLLRALQWADGRRGAAHAVAQLALRPAEAWADWGAAPGRGTLQAVGLVMLGIAAIVLLGMPAAVSEWLIALGCLGLATCVARQAPLANLGGRLHWHGLVVVGGAMAAAVGGALWRGDLGHALVALAMGGCFVWLFGGAVMRVLLVAGVLAGLALLLLGHVQGHQSEPLATLIGWLPPHAQDRMNALFDPFQADSSDLARTRWLMRSAGNTGWGAGYVPWMGLAPARVHEGLPLQGPSDYITALVVAQWGAWGGLAAMAAVLLVFGAAAFAAARTAFAAGMAPGWRLLAGLGLFGCVVMAGKVLLSAGGVLGLLPLTGLPVALLGYGPVSLLAGLLYLALALGCAGAAPAALGGGVSLQPVAAADGAVRRRSRRLALVALAGLGLLVGGGLWRLQADVLQAPALHTSAPRLALAQAVADAIVKGDPAAAAAAQAEAQAWAGCAAFEQAVQVWNQRLAALPGAPAVTWHLNGAALLARRGVVDDKACRSLARDLGRMLDTDWQRLVGELALPARTPSALPTTGEPQRDKPLANARDYRTPNAWWGVPGCVRPVGADAAPCRLLGPEADGLGDALWLDPWLHQELLPRLQAAVRTPQGERQLNHRPVPTGPVLTQTLDAQLQATAQRIADCYTARRSAADCEAALPRDAAWRARHFGPGGLRAGALGLVLTEVDSGRVVALAGALSDCSAQALQRPAHAVAPRQVPAHAVAQRQVPALWGEQPCAQLPDQRSSFLLTQHPALWMVGPGSSLKTLAALAGVEAGHIAPADDGRWKSILAESHEQAPVQAAALAAGPRYLATLAAAGFGAPAGDLLWGTPVAAKAAAPNADAGAVTPGAPLGMHWRPATRSGQEQLRPVAMDFATMQALRHEKEQGVDVDRRHGHARISEYLAARRLADTAIGSADLRISALGLADVWRRLDLTARGRASAAVPHLLERAGQAQPPVAMGLGQAEAARRVIGMTGGITSSAWKGTAQGSCRVVFGTCPAEGLPGLAGKTGTADFLLAEDSPWVKPGLQLPAKLFGGVFSARGQRYAVAVMVLRNRDAGGRTLDLQSSAAAEAALTLVREMGGATP